MRAVDAAILARRRNNFSGDVLCCQESQTEARAVKASGRAAPKTREMHYAYRWRHQTADRPPIVR